MKPWLTIPEYMKKTGLGRNVVMKMIEDKKIVAMQTDGGHWRIKTEEDPALEALNAEVTELKHIILNLCNHLGVRQPEKLT